RADDAAQSARRARHSDALGIGFGRDEARGRDGALGSGMARGMTLGQAAGGRPRRVQAPGASRPTAARLGLGLGMGPKQRGAFQQAAQQGQAGGWLGAHPEVAHRFATPNQQFGAARGNFLLSGGQSQAPGPRGGPMGPPQPPPAQQRPPTMIGQQPPPQTFGQVGGNMYGQMQGNYGPRDRKSV